MKRVAITSGDVDGIGLEVTVKALRKIGPEQGIQFVVFRSNEAPAFSLPGFERVQVPSLPEAIKSPSRSKILIEVLRKDSPAQWVEDVAKACLKRDFASMVTAPLSKQEIQKAGFSDIGHTDILKRVSNSKNAFMTFMGPFFNVLLISGHLPLKSVESHLSTDLISEAFDQAQRARRLLPIKRQKKPIAVLGLNPHAGDQGLIGEFDGEVLQPLIRKMSRSMNLVGPLVPDVAFLRENWNKYSVYVAQYHDQGLIPFKMAHGFDAGVHLTLGLPILRSSVDHGTAKDLFGKNKANPGSMIEAIRWGVRLARKG